MKKRGYQVEFIHHARAILQLDFPEVLNEIETVLLEFSITVESLVRGGGGEHTLTQGLRRAFHKKSWRKHKFNIQKLVDGAPRESTSHEIDHVRRLNGGTIAMEIEWNNKDPFFDRDLENFKRLHAEAAISVGIMLTRGTTLHEALRRRILKFANDREIRSFDDLKGYKYTPTDRQRELIEAKLNRRRDSFARAWSETFVSDKFGEATTHWRKLEDRVHRGVGSPCPLLLIGIPEEVLTD